MQALHEPLPHVDAAWLRMDGPTNPMVITSRLSFDDLPDVAAIERLVDDRLLRARRFRQRVVEPMIGAPYWEDDPTFDPRAHIHRVALPAPGGARELEALISDLASQPLDRGRPLWQAYLVETGQGGALVTRLHHCIGDGVALVMLLLGLTDEGSAMIVPEVGVTAPHDADLSARARHAADEARTLARILALRSDPPSPLRGALGPRKRLIVSRPVPLRDVKAIGAALGATVNDVVVAALAGAVRCYLLPRGFAADYHEIRAMMPMYLRGHAAAGDLGNHFGMVYLTLPVGIVDPVERVRVTHSRMDAIKRSPEAEVTLDVIGALGFSIRPVEDVAIDLFTRKASTMITNVAGPPAPLHLAGKQITDMVVWAPVSGHLGLGISVLSYAGALRIGLQADVHSIPDVEELIAAIDAELAALVTATAT